MKIQLQNNMSTKLVTIDENESLNQALVLMKTHQVRHLPVTRVQNEIVGILSDRDLQRAMVSEISGEGLFLTEQCVFNPSHQVKDYMSWPIKAVHKDDHLKHVVDLFLKEKISASVVTDHSEVVGIVTTDDLMKVLSALIAEKEDSSLKINVENFLMNPTIGKLAQAISDIGI